MTTPWMWIVAGPNGAGKTSVATQTFSALNINGLVKLNADVRTAELRVLFPDAPLQSLNLRAAQEIDAQVLDNIENGKDFLVETVLSSPKYRDAVLKAKEKGYSIGLIYVSLHPPELSPERIKLRVEKGGHDVDPVKAIERYQRSHQQLEWFAEQANTFVAIDNSGTQNSSPIIIASKFAGKELVHRTKEVNPAVDRVVEMLIRKQNTLAAKLG
jgi:predicted ABC-type ATPase